MQVVEELGSQQTVLHAWLVCADISTQFTYVCDPAPLPHFIVHFKCNSAYAFGSAAEFVCYLL